MSDIANFHLMPVLIPRVLIVVLKPVCVMPHQYAVLQVLHEIKYLIFIHLPYNVNECIEYKLGWVPPYSFNTFISLVTDCTAKL